MLVPQLPPGEGQASVESEVPEEAMERLAHLEQLVVQLKELIRDRDTQLVQKDTELAGKDAQLKVNNLRVCLLSTRPFSVFLTPMSVVHIRRMRKKKLRLASPNSNCRPKPRWHHSTNRYLI